MKIKELLEWEPPLDPKPVQGRPIDPRGPGNTTHGKKHRNIGNREAARVIDRTDTSVRTPNFKDTVGPNGEPKEIPLK